MAFKRFRTKVDTGWIATSATTQFVLGTQDMSALPGGEQFVSRGAYSIKSIIYILDNSGAHGSRIYAKIVGGYWNAGAGLQIDPAPSNWSGSTNGIIAGNAAFGATFAADILGTSWRFLATPPSATAYNWLAIHDVEYVEI